MAQHHSIKGTTITESAGEYRRNQFVLNKRVKRRPVGCGEMEEQAISKISDEVLQWLGDNCFSCASSQPCKKQNNVFIGKDQNILRACENKQAEE